MHPVILRRAVPYPAQTRVARSFGTLVLVAAWALLSLAAGFRWLGNSRDYYEYLYYYNTMPDVFFFKDTRFEPGFHILAWVSKKILNIGYDYFALGLVSFSLGVKFYLFRKHLRYPLLAAATYVAIFYPNHEYTQLRAAFALALGYAAIHLLLNHKLLKGIGLLALGVAFHYSVIVLGVVYVIAKYLRGRAAILVLTIGLLVASMLTEQIVELVVNIFGGLNPILKHYAKNDQMYDDANLLSFNNLLLLASVVSATLLGWLRCGRYHRTFLTFSIAALAAIALLGGSPVVAQRLKEVLFISIIFLVYRSPITAPNLPPVAFTWMNAALLFYLAFREGLIAI